MSLLQQLTELGDNLIAGEVPAGHEVPKIVAGIVHFLETGTLEAPERLPSAAVARELSEDKAEIDRLRAAVERLEAGQTAPPAVPTPQAPVPPAPPVAAAPPAPAAPPSPVAPVPPTSPAPPAGGQAVPPPVPLPVPDA